jgi:S-layer protein
MPYSQANLTTFFTNSSTGTTPTAAQQLALQALASQNASGQITDAQAQQQAVALGANNTTTVGVEAYQFFAGFAPNVAGLTALNAAYSATGPQAGLNGENRFIAQSVSLALQNTAAKASFNTLYGTLSIADATKAAYEIIVGTPAATAAGINVANAVAFLSSAASVTYYTNFVKANVPGLATGTAADIDLAVKAAIVGEIMYTATSFNNGTGVGAYSSANNKLLADLADDGKLVADVGSTSGINLFTSYGTSAQAGKSFALVTGIDALVGTDGVDTFQGSDTTLTAGDSIDGGAGVDILNLTMTAGKAAAIDPLAKITNIETINLTSDSASAVDVQALAGVTTVTLNQVGTAAANSITTKGNVTTAAITGGTTAAVTDAAATDTLSSVTITGSTGANTLTSDALTSVTLNGAAGATAVVNTTAKHTLTLAGSGTNGAVTDTAATTVNLAPTATVTMPLVVAAATALNVTGSAVATITGSTLTALTKVTISGAAGLTDTDSLAGMTIDASATSGANSLTLGTTSSFAGGTGIDKITIAADPTLAISGGSNTTDQLVLNAAAATFSDLALAKVTGFERLGTGTGTTGNYDLTKVAGITTGWVNGGEAAAYGFIGATAATSNLTFNAASAKDVSLALGNSTGTADVANITLGSSATAGSIAQAATTLTLAGYEIVNVAAVGKATSLDTIKIADVDAQTINVSGAANLVLTTTGTTALIKVDGTASSGGIDTSAVVWKVTGGTTAIGGSGADVLLGGNGANTLTGGAGADTFVIRATGHSGTLFDTVTDAAKGDIIDFTTAVGTFTTAKIVLADVAVYQDYLDAATTGNATHNAAWFQFAGNTYVVQDESAAGTFQGGVDTVVKLVGLHDLSTTDTSINAGGNLVLGN